FAHRIALDVQLGGGGRQRNAPEVPLRTVEERRLLLAQLLPERQHHFFLEFQEVELAAQALLERVDLARASGETHDEVAAVVAARRHGIAGSREAGGEAGGLGRRDVEAETALGL